MQTTIHRTRIRPKVATMLVLAIALLALITTTLVPAEAGSTTRAMEVSCDGVTIKYGVTVNHHPGGTFRITQNSTNPTSVSRTWATSAYDNDLPIRNIANLETATWTNVIASNYTVKVFRDGSSNCNGWRPGLGNYWWNYTVDFN